MKTIVNERKLDFFDLINEGTRIFIFRIRDYSLLSLINIFSAALFYLVVLGKSPSQDNAENILQLLLIFLTGLILFLFALFTTVSNAIITEGVVANKSISLSDALKLAMSKWDRALSTQLLYGLIIFALTLLLVIPGVVYSVYYLFALYVVVLRDKVNMEALRYSKTLVEGQWGRIFWIVAGLQILLWFITVGLSLLVRKISTDPYISILPNLVSFYLSSIFNVIYAVLFLNTDFVYFRRLVKRNRPHQE